MQARSPINSQILQRKFPQVYQQLFSKCQWENTGSASLIQKKELGFDTLFRLAWKISVAYRDGKSSGLSVFNSLLPTKYPIAYSLERKRPGHVPANIGLKYELIDKTNYWGTRAKEIFEIAGEPSWPIDFGIIIVPDKTTLTMVY